MYLLKKSNLYDNITVYTGGIYMIKNTDENMKKLEEYIDTRDFDEINKIRMCLCRFYLFV